MLLVCLLFTGTPATATQQLDDIIIYNNEKCALRTHWAYPSPLQVYFKSNKEVEYPFTSSSTANHRGHIATWKIDNNRLFLTHIDTGSISFDRKTFEIAETRREIDLGDIFPEDTIVDDAVPADWFSGFILISARPYKEWFEAPYSDEKYAVTKYREYVIVQLESGRVVRTRPFSTEEYWSISRMYHNYHDLAPEDREVFESYHSYLASFRKHPLRMDRTAASAAPKIEYTAQDFDAFIIRYFTKTAYIPLTDLSLIKDATIDFDDPSAFLAADMRIREGKDLLVIEMNPNELPPGPWEDHAGGSVQILVGLDDASPEVIDLANSTEAVKLINNFARFRSPQTLAGTLRITKVRPETARVVADIELRSEDPSTLQRIRLDSIDVGMISILEYLEVQKSNSRLCCSDVDKTYREIKAKSDSDLENR